MFWPGRYGVAETIYFPLIDAGAQDFEATPVTFASGDTKVSKDGGTFTNTGSNPAHVAGGIYKLDLTATEMQARVNVVTIIDSATKAWEDQAIIIHNGLTHQMLAYDAVEYYQVNNVSTTPLSTAFEADRQLGRSEEATADHFNSRFIFFVSGALAGSVTDITDYALQNTRGFFTVTDMGEAPADNDFFIIL